MSSMLRTNLPSRWGVVVAHEVPGNARDVRHDLSAPLPVLTSVFRRRQFGDLELGEDHHDFRREFVVQTEVFSCFVKYTWSSFYARKGGLTCNEVVEIIADRSLFLDLSRDKTESRHKQGRMFITLFLL